jgi:TPR repeat protein
MPGQGNAAPIENPKPSTKPNETAVQPQPKPTESPKPPVMGTSSANLEQQAAALNEQGRYTEAIPLYDRACSSGNMIACHQLGMIYDLGHGVPKDEPRAVALVTKACDGNDAEACRLLGDTYYNGRDLPKNTPKAVELLARGCELGATNSCGDLGTIYGLLHGNSVLLQMAKVQSPFRSMGMNLF